MLDVIAGLLAMAGSGLALVAAIGLLRLPNFLARTHAASLVGSVGAGLILVAVALVAPGGGFATRAIAALLLLFLTTPVAAHLLAKASYRSGETSRSSTSKRSAGREATGRGGDRKGQTPEATK